MGYMAFGLSLLIFLNYLLYEKIQEIENQRKNASFLNQDND